MGSSALYAQVPPLVDNWVGPAGTPGSWFSITNWLPAILPITGTSAIVNNGGIAQIGTPPLGTPNATASNLTIGSTIAGSQVQLQPGGNLAVSNSITVGAGGTLLFSGGVATAPGIVDNGNLQFTIGYINAIPISGTGNVSVTGGTVTLTGANTYSGTTTIGGGGTLRPGVAGGLSPNSTFVVNSTLDLNGFSSTIGTLAGTGTVLNNGAAAATLTAGNNNASTTFSGAIQNGTGVLGLTKTGIGSLTLSGNNTYSGPTTITAGTLIAGSSTALSPNSAFTVNTTLDLNGFSNTIGSLAGSGRVLNGLVLGLGVGTVPPAIAAAATLTVGNDNTSTIFSGIIENVANVLALTKSGTGTLTLTGGNIYSGGTTINSGTLQIGNAGTTGSIIGNVVDNSVLTFDRSNPLAFAGSISGPGSVTQIGTGTTTLSGNNTYTGGTTISAGTLQAASITGLSPTSAFTVNSILDLNGFSNTIGSLAGAGIVLNNAPATTAILTAGNDNTSTTFSGLLENGAGFLGLIKSGTGTLILTGNNLYTGGTTISAGTLQLGNGGLTGSIIGNVVDNSVLTFDRSNLLTFAGSISGAGSVNQIGTGITTLSGNNTYTGGTTINGGTLQAGSITGLSPNSAFIVNSILDLNGFNTTIGSLSGTGFVLNNAAATTAILTTGNDNTSTTFSGLLENGTGVLGLTKSGTGTQTLTGNNTYTGGTTINGGTLQLGNGGTTGTIVGNVANNGILAFDRSDTLIFAGAISGLGSVTQIGTGTTILTGNSSYTGGTTISAGTLQLGNGGTTGAIIGNVINNGVLSFDRSDSATFGGLISGAGSLTQIGTGTTILTGNNTYTGGTTISVGTLQLGNGGTTGAIVGDVIDNGVLSFNRSDSVTFAGLISGVGSVAQIGSGTTILSGNNTYTGGTTISLGTLQLGNGGAAGGIVGNILDNGILTFNRSDTITFGGLISGAGSVNQAGTGTTILTNNNTYSGGTTIGSGTLQLGNGGTTGSIIGNVVDNSVLVFNRSDTVTFGGLISGSGSVSQVGTGTAILTNNNTYTGGTTISTGTLQLGNGGTTGSVVGNVTDNSVLAFNRSDPVTFGGIVSGTGALVNIGTGTLILTGSNTYTGGTTISAGTLQIGNGGTSGSITGNVLDNSVLAFNRSDSLTFGGVISGAGRLVNLGTGTLTLTGTNTYTGGTTISAGTLQIGNGGTTGSITGNVLDNGLLVFNRSDFVTFGGVISGTGGLIQQGTGVLTLQGASTYTGTTLVNNGSLIVDGAIGSLQTIVNAGGFLGGHGTIGGNLINNGIVGQLLSPGTLTVLGNFIQNAGGTLRIALGGLTAGLHDLLAVNGHVTLGGTLQIVTLGNFSLQPGNEFVFLTANNGVSGTFSSVLTGTIVQGVVITLPNAVLVQGKQGSFTEIPGFTLTPNEAAVAKALNSAIGDPRAAALIAFLNSQPLANLPRDLALIAPTQITSLNATAVSLGNIQLSNLEQRLGEIREGSTGFSSSGFTLGGPTASLGQGFAGVTGPEGKGGPPSVFAPVPNNRWGVFLTGLGEFTNVNSTSNAPGYDVDTGGFTFGVDYRLTPNFAIGLTAGYAHTSVHPDGGGNIDVNGGKIGLYATAFAKGFYLDAAVSGGPSGYTTRRTALLGTASGNTNGADVNALVAAGYDWKYGNLTLGPTASFQFSYVGLDSFTETGSLAPLKFPDQNTESERTAIGGKASYDWKVGHITVIPQVSAAWQHEYGDTEYSVAANFASGAGSSFTVRGPHIGRDSLLLGAGATVIWNDRVSTYLYYDGEVARTNYQSHNVSGGVRISF